MNNDLMGILFLAMNLFSLLVGARLERNRWESKSDQPQMVSTSTGLYIVKRDVRFKD